ncbi:DNA repair protein SWI5 homolog isoform X2 [Antedon mediterranea]|uniref:DNA repair protein SWI5 homolog isoform X2 n=1 Tax=Antedon mediterranea TaxID=105859 RepID=UPI003AF797A2
MSTTPLQFKSNSMSKRRSLGLSRKWLSPAAASPSSSSSSPAGPEMNSTSVVGLRSPNTTSKALCNRESVSLHGESPRPVSTVPPCSNVTPNRYSNPRKRNFKATFKSPMKKLDSEMSPQEEVPHNIQQEIINLKEEIKLMEDEEKELRKCGFVEEELQVHIEKLHEYNELKDAGQMLLATLEGRTTKEMYEKFGLDLDD